MAIHKSGEDYLEAILMVRQEKGYCRSIDVAHHLNVSKPSVSVAMGILREGGMVTTDEDGLLNFTEEGLKLATDVYNRHCLLTEFLLYLGVEDRIARADACKIEHDISPETYQCLRKFVDDLKAKGETPAESVKKRKADFNLKCLWFQKPQAFFAQNSDSIPPQGSRGRPRRPARRGKPPCSPDHVRSPPGSDAYPGA